MLASAYPRAAGEAIYVKMGFGELSGRIVGLGVVAIAITSSAVISLAFAGYLGALTGFHSPASVVGILVLLGFVAWLGVRESVGFASLITVLEVGTLAVVVFGGFPLLATDEAVARLAALPSDATSLTAVFAGAFLAFFAYIGFEDIENMAEETKKSACGHSCGHRMDAGHLRGSLWTGGRGRCFFSRPASAGEQRCAACFAV